MHDFQLIDLLFPEQTYLEILSLSADDLDTDVNENVTDEPPPEVLVIG